MLQEVSLLSQVRKCSLWKGVTNPCSWLVANRGSEVILVLRLNSRHGHGPVAKPLCASFFLSPKWGDSGTYFTRALNDSEKQLTHVAQSMATTVTGGAESVSSVSSAPSASLGQQGWLPVTSFFPGLDPVPGVTKSPLRLDDGVIVEVCLWL